MKEIELMKKSAEKFSNILINISEQEKRDIYMLINGIILEKQINKNEKLI